MGRHASMGACKEQEPALTSVLLWMCGSYIRIFPSLEDDSDPIDMDAQITVAQLPPHSGSPHPHDYPPFLIFLRTSQRDYYVSANQVGCHSHHKEALLFFSLLTCHTYYLWSHHSQPAPWKLPVPGPRLLLRCFQRLISFEWSWTLLASFALCRLGLQTSLLGPRSPLFTNILLKHCTQFLGKSL